MDNQPKSIVMPIAITALVSGVIFGVGGYYLASGQFGTDDTDTAAGVLTTPSPKVTTTSTAIADVTADWKTWTRTERQSDKFTFKTPKDWVVTGADSDGSSNVLVYDETRQATERLTAGYKLIFQFASHGTVPSQTYADFKQQPDDGAPAPTITGAKQVTIGGYVYDYQVENGTQAAYYYKLSDTRYLRIGYTLADADKATIEDIIKSVNLAPSASALTSATQIN